MSKDAADPDLERWKELAKLAQDDFKQTCDTWKQLEVKAQGLITATGIFVAALVTLSARIPAPTKSQAWGLTLPLLCFAGSVISALRVLLIRSTPDGLTEPALRQQTMAFLAAISAKPDERPARTLAFFSDQATCWSQDTVAMHDLNNSKANALAWAQGMAIAGVGVAVIFALIVLWKN